MAMLPAVVGMFLPRGMRQSSTCHSQTSALALLISRYLAPGALEDLASMEVVSAARLAQVGWLPPAEERGAFWGRAARQEPVVRLAARIRA